MATTTTTIDETRIIDEPVQAPATQVWLKRVGGWFLNLVMLLICFIMILPVLLGAGDRVRASAVGLRQAPGLVPDRPDAGERATRVRRHAVLAAVLQQRQGFAADHGGFGDHEHDGGLRLRPAPVPGARCAVRGLPRRADGARPGDGDPNLHPDAQPGPDEHPRGALDSRPDQRVRDFPAAAVLPAHPARPGGGRQAGRGRILPDHVPDRRCRWRPRPFRPSRCSPSRPPGTISSRPTCS